MTDESIAARIESLERAIQQHRKDIANADGKILDLSRLLSDQADQLLALSEQLAALSKGGLR